MSTDNAFTQWFQQATGCTPYPFQIRFACEPTLFMSPLPSMGKGSGEGASHGGLLVHVPTGLGKTAMAVLGWPGWCEERSSHCHLKTGWCP